MSEGNRRQRRAAEKAEREAQEKAKRSIVSAGPFHKLQGYIKPAKGGVNIDLGEMCTDMAAMLKLSGATREQTLEVVGQAWDQIEIEVRRPN
jgi:hypothetical protein